MLAERSKNNSRKSSITERSQGNQLWLSFLNMVLGNKKDSADGLKLDEASFVLKWDFPFGHVCSFRFIYSKEITPFFLILDNNFSDRVLLVHPSHVINEICPRPQ